MKNQSNTSGYGLGLAIGLFSFVITLNTASANTQDLLKAADPAINKQYVRAEFGKVQNKAFDANDQRKKLLIIGDSQAQDFVNSAREHQFLKDYQVRTRHIPAKCQPYLGDPAQSGVENKDKAFCESVETLSKSKTQIAEADIVILAALWREWAASQLPQTIANLELDATQKLVVLGRKSFGKISLRHYLRMTEDKRKALRNPINKKFLSANQQMKQGLPNDVFVDQYALICGEGQTTCPVFTPSGELISFDGGHLTKPGASYVGSRIFMSAALAQLK